MNLTKLKNKRRVAFSLAVALAGLVVSFAMVHVGGPTAHHLPGIPFHVAAVFGAGLAGWWCCDAFGRTAASGWAIALAGSVAMTFLGAVLGSVLIGAVFDGLTAALAFPVLGFVSIIDAAESPVAVLIWLLCMAGLHVFARKIRSSGPIL